MAKTSIMRIVAATLVVSWIALLATEFVFGTQIGGTTEKLVLIIGLQIAGVAIYFIFLNKVVDKILR